MGFGPKSAPFPVTVLVLIYHADVRAILQHSTYGNDNHDAEQVISSVRITRQNIMTFSLIYINLRLKEALSHGGTAEPHTLYKRTSECIFIPLLLASFQVLVMQIKECNPGLHQWNTEETGCERGKDW